MLAQSLRIASRPLARPLLTRTFVSTTRLRADIVQDIYLRELKAYKPAPVTAADAEGQVKKWVPPAAPQVPEVASSLAAELEAYEKQEVEVEGQVETSATGEVEKTEDDWFESDEAWGLTEDKNAHH